MKNNKTEFKSQITVKVYPGLCTAALKAKLDKKELALWFELRAINSTGSSIPGQQWSTGRLVLHDVVDALVKHFGYSQSTAYRLLKAGKGKLWDIKHPPRAKRTNRRLPFWIGYQSRGQGYYSTGLVSPVIEIYSLLRVAKYFNTWVGRAVEVRVSDFKGTRGKKTAWLYASFFKPAGSRANPISRESIEADTGVLIRQQKRYDKVAGIKKFVNFACYENSQGKMMPLRHIVYSKSRQWSKDKRLGNTYHSRAIKANRGMIDKLNAELQRSLQRNEARLPKRFFLSARSLIKSSVRDNEAYLLVKKRDRIIPGRTEWCIEMA